MTSLDFDAIDLGYIISHLDISNPSTMVLKAHLANVHGNSRYLDYLLSGFCKLLQGGKHKFSDADLFGNAFPSQFSVSKTLIVYLLSVLDQKALPNDILLSVPNKLISRTNGFMDIRNILYEGKQIELGEFCIKAPKDSSLKMFDYTGHKITIYAFWNQIVNLMLSYYAAIDYGIIRVNLIKSNLKIMWI